MATAAIRLKTTTYFRLFRSQGLQKHLTHSGIGTLIHYPVPPHQQKAYSEYQDIDLPIALTLSRELLSIPLHPHLTEDEVNTCIAAVRQYFS